MKKIALFVSVLLLAGSLFAQDDASAKVDALAKKVPALGGSVTFNFGSDDLTNNPLTFSGSKTGTVGDLTVGIDNDQVSAGVTIGTTPVITKTSGASAADFAKDTINARDYLVKAYDFYVGKKNTTSWDSTAAAIQWRNVDGLLNALKGVQTTKIATNHSKTWADIIKVEGTNGATGTTGTDGVQAYTNGSWTVTIADPKTQDADVTNSFQMVLGMLYTAIEADLRTMTAQYVIGTNLGLPVGNAKTAAGVSALGAPFAETAEVVGAYSITTKTTIGVKASGVYGTNATTIPANSVAIGMPAYGDENHNAGNYYYVLNDGVTAGYVVTEALGKQIKNVVNALKSLSDNVKGATSDDTWAASWKISNAYFKIKKVFGVVDMGFVVEGKAVSVGSMVTSKLTSADKGSQVGFTLGLSKGVVEGLSADVLLNLSSGTKAASVDNYYDFDSLTTAKADPVAGLQLDVGYATDMFGVKLAVGSGDLVNTAKNLLVSVQPSLSLKDIAGLNVGAEFTLARGTTPGVGVGVKVGASVMGISPTVTWKMKDANFKGDDSFNLNGTDKIDATSLSGEFNTTDNAAMNLDVALAVDLKDLIGMKLVTVNGGFGIMLQNAANSKNNFGFSGGIGLDLNEVLAMPITFNWSISQYAAEDLVNSFKLGYTYGAANLAAEFKIKGTTNSLNISAGVKF